MGNTVGGDDKPVLQCRTDGRMIPIVYGRQIVPAVAKKKRPAVAKSLPLDYYQIK